MISNLKFCAMIKAGGWSFRDRLLLLIILSIGFQQFPVIRAGGSFRVYELLSLLVLLVSIRKGDLFKCQALSPFLFFVIAPLVSLLGFLLFFRFEVGRYYQIFPETSSLRFDPFAGSIVPFLYYGLCWVSFSSISRSTWINKNFLFVMRCIVYSGVAISIYSICCALLMLVFQVPSPLSMLPSAIQNLGKAHYGTRVSGLSQEPSFYVLFQGWICFFAVHYRSLFKKAASIIIIIICFLALGMTQSSALAGFLVAYGFVAISAGTVKRRMKVSISFVIALSAAFLFVQVFADENQIRYILVGKVVNFFSAPTNTLDSGAFRAYTAALGFFIFKDYPIFGVGPGSSMFFMHQHIDKIPLTAIGDEIGPGIFPQNLYVSVLSDLGLFGFLCFLLFWLPTMYRIAKGIRSEERLYPFFQGVVFTTLAFFSVAPAYSMFLWVFVALGVNLLYFKKEIYSPLNSESPIQKDFGKTSFINSNGNSVTRDAC